MPRLADVVRRHGPAYLERFRASILPGHVCALRAIMQCRTPEMGGHLAECPHCRREHLLFHSCRHRACPQCGYDTTTRWLERQRELLLPVPYFHVVFTIPEELRRLVRSHQLALLPVLFRAAFDSLAALCADPRFLGAHIGALAVLHTWTRTLEWHPHIHMLVPAGGLAPDGRTWLHVRSRKKRFLVHVHALAEHFRGRFLHLARRALPGVEFPHIPWKKRWVVFAKPVVQGAEKILDYLGRYVHRTAMSDKAIVGCDEHTVTFRYRHSRDHSRRAMTLPAHEFLRRFLQHVPPKGMHRVRAFGLLHPDHRATLRQLQLLLAPRVSHDLVPPTPEPPLRPRLPCPHCKMGALRLIRRLDPLECIARLATSGTGMIPLARAPPPPSLEVGAAE